MLLIRRDAIPASKLEACGGEDFFAGEAVAKGKSVERSTGRY